MMLPLFLAFLSALSLTGYAGQRSVTNANPYEDHIVVERRRIVLVRGIKLAKHFPHRKTAVVIYPIVSGLSDPVVLRRVRSLLEFKNIFDYTLQDYRNDTWLSEFDYTVNYNRNYLFDITFTQSGAAAYPAEHSKHFLINLKNGASSRRLTPLWLISYQLSRQWLTKAASGTQAEDRTDGESFRTRRCGIEKYCRRSGTDEV